MIPIIRMMTASSVHMLPHETPYPCESLSGAGGRMPLEVWKRIKIEEGDLISGGTKNLIKNFTYKKILDTLI